MNGPKLNKPRDKQMSSFEARLGARTTLHDENDVNCDKYRREGHAK